MTWYSPRSDRASLGDDWHIDVWTSVFLGTYLPESYGANAEPAPMHECPRCASDFFTLKEMQEHITRDHNHGKLAEVITFPSNYTTVNSRNAC